MAGIASSLAQGFESGYGLGLKTDKANEDKRRHKVGEEFQAKQDQRAEAELGLRTRTQDRLEERQDQAMEIERAKTTMQFADSELKDLVAASAGGAATEDMAQRFGRAMKAKEFATNTVSGWTTGQGSPKTADPDTAYIVTALSSGRLPEDWQQVPTGVKDLTTGLQTKNGPLTLKGASVVLAPWLRRGIGETNEYGTITRKELVGLDPDPTRADYVIPRLRVYVNTPYGEKFYDAPMTRGGSASKEDDTVVGINMKRGFDYMGNADVLAKGLSEPEIAAKLAQASPEAKEQAKRWLDELNARGKASQPKVGATEEKIAAIRKFAMENNIPFEAAAKRLQGGGILTDKVATPGAMQKTIDAIKGLGLSPEEEAAAIKGVVLKASTPAGAGKKGSDVPLSQEAIDQTAAAALKDRSALVGIGRDPGKVTQVLNRMAELAPKGDIAGNRVAFTADATSLKKIVPMYDAVVAFENNTIAQGKVLKDLAKKVDATGTPVIERWIRAGRKQVAGDPDVSEFDAQLTLFGAEAAKILTNPNLTGVLTDSARHEVAEFLPKNASAAQIIRVVDRLETDFGLRKKSLEDQTAIITKRLADRNPEKASIIDKATQTERDSDALSILRAERIAQARRVEDAKKTGDPTMLKRAQEDLATLDRELAAKGGGKAAPATTGGGGGSPPIAALKEGQVTTFANGQKWTLKNGQPAKVQ